MKFVNMSKKLVKYSETHVPYVICRIISLFAGGKQQIVGGIYTLDLMNDKCGN